MNLCRNYRLVCRWRAGRQEKASAADQELIQTLLVLGKKRDHTNPPHHHTTKPHKPTHLPHATVHVCNRAVVVLCLRCRSAAVPEAEKELSLFACPHVSREGTTTCEHTRFYTADFRMDHCAHRGSCLLKHQILLPF